MKALSGVGLALSGGGFRASLFHLGVARRLHELGILQQVTRLSTVSGGSILAGFLADRLLANGRKQLSFDDWSSEVADPFRRFVRRDIRTGLFLRHMLWNVVFSGPRARGYEKALYKRLTPRCLTELPRKGDGVEFIFLATDIRHGLLWRFSSERIGEHESGMMPTPADMTIARAVAASACFPPIFGPIPIKIEGRETAWLTDGGVYDNTGMEPVWDQNRIVLVSDCGSPFKHVVPKWYGSRLMRYAEIGLNQVGAQRRRAVVRRLLPEYATVRTFPPGKAPPPEVDDACDNAGQPGCFMTNRRLTDKPAGAYWRLESQKESFRQYASKAFLDELAALEKGWYGYADASPTDVVPAVVCGIRTDLDTFTLAESAILENHGYFMADIAVRRYAPQIADFSAAFDPPNPDWTDDAAVRQALKHSASRLACWRRWGH